MPPPLLPPLNGVGAGAAANPPKGDGEGATPPPPKGDGDGAPKGLALLDAGGANGVDELKGVEAGAPNGLGLVGPAEENWFPDPPNGPGVGAPKGLGLFVPATEKGVDPPNDPGAGAPNGLALAGAGAPNGPPAEEPKAGAGAPPNVLVCWPKPPIVDPNVAAGAGVCPNTLPEGAGAAPKGDGALLAFIALLLELPPKGEFKGPEFPKGEAIGAACI